jgi:hypothetical protein
MNRTLALLALCTLTLTGCAGHSHYAGLQAREIKALSAEDISGLKAGKGMSMALPAELNGYPGPLHVLELADRLALTAAQRARTQQLFERMRADAVQAGEAVIAGESALDRLFASRTATPQALSSALERVGAAQARLRNVHLQAHLEQTAILSAEQVAQYHRIRGYGR